MPYFYYTDFTNPFFIRAGLFHVVAQVKRMALAILCGWLRRISKVGQPGFVCRKCPGKKSLSPPDYL